MEGENGPPAERMPWPGYELPEKGRRLLSWSWAVSRLERSSRYWLATSGRTGEPHLAAVWGVWVDGMFVFSTGRRTRKARNLAGRPNCMVSTENAGEAVLVDGVGEEVRDGAFMARVEAAYIGKYGSSVRSDDGPVFAVRPRLIVGIVDSSTTALPTRWRLERTTE